MNRENLVIIILGILAIVFLFSLLIFNTYFSENAKFCKEHNIVSNCNGAIDCYKDCEDLGLKSFKVENPSIGSSADCWCKLNNETKQIW